MEDQNATQESSEPKDPLAEFAKDEQGRFVVPLSNPITRKSNDITELRFREPRARDIRDIGYDSLTIGKAGLDIAERCGTVNDTTEVTTRGIIDNMSIEDAAKVLSLMAHFYRPVVQQISNLLS